MKKKSDFDAFIGLMNRIDNIIFGYRPRGKDVNKRTKRTISKR